MDLLDEEVLIFWKHMHENNVRYILVGGFATNLNGFSRMTADMDVWIEDTKENRKKLGIVLSKLELMDITNIDTMQFVPGWTSLSFSSGFQLDIMTYMNGLPQESFAECYEMAPTALIEEIPVRFLHINHLIETKQKTGRPKDLIDLEELIRIRNKS